MPPSLPIISREVICKPAKTKERPIFVFVAGAEGTGHHLMVNITKSAPDVETLPLVVRQMLAEMWEPIINEERKEKKRAALIAELKWISDDAMEAKRNGSRTWMPHFLAQKRGWNMFSFPFDNPRNAMRRPDLFDLFSIFEPHFDVRILVMVRNPKDCLISLLRRMYFTLKLCNMGQHEPVFDPRLFSEYPLGECGVVPFQARIVEDAFVYLSAQLEVISTEYFRVIDYDAVFSNATSFARPLADFLGLSEPSLARILETNINEKGMPKEMLTDQQHLLVNSIFTPARALQWSYIMKPDLNILSATNQDALAQEEKCLSPVL